MSKLYKQQTNQKIIYIIGRYSEMDWIVCEVLNMIYKSQKITNSKLTTNLSYVMISTLYVRLIIK